MRVIPADHLMGIDLVDPLWIGSDEDIGLLVGSDPGFWGLNRQIDHIANHEDPFSFLLVVGALKQSHDFLWDAEMSMAEHLGSRSDMQVDLVEVLDLFSSLEPNTVCLPLADSFFHELFLHLLDSC